MRARIFQEVKLTHLESQWCLQELEKRFTANTHTHAVHSKEHKSSCDSERVSNGCLDKARSHLQLNNPKKKKKRQDWQVELETNQNVHGVQPIWLIFVTSNMIHVLSHFSISFTFSPSLLCLLASQLCYLGSPGSNWLLGLFSFFLSLSHGFLPCLMLLSFLSNIERHWEGEFRYIKWCCFHRLFFSAQRSS